MKRSKLIIAALVLFCVALCVSCNKGDDPIRLTYEYEEVILIDEQNTLKLSPVETDGLIFYISGGDGKYTVENTNNDTVEAIQSGNKVTFKPVALGSSTVTITDNSGRSYTLKIKVAYSVSIYKVFAHQAGVAGGEMTSNQIAELKSTMLASIPVEVGGRYEFTWKTRRDPENSWATSGDVVIYTSSSTTTPLTGTFEVRQVADFLNGNHDRYTITVGTETYVYNYYRYGQISVGSRSVMQQTRWMFLEDVTNKYTGEYPALETAIAIQGITYK